MFAGDRLSGECLSIIVLHQHDTIGESESNLSDDDDE